MWDFNIFVVPLAVPKARYFSFIKEAPWLAYTVRVIALSYGPKVAASADSVLPNSRNEYKPDKEFVGCFGLLGHAYSCSLGDPFWGFLYIWVFFVNWKMIFFLVKKTLGMQIMSLLFKS